MDLDSADIETIYYIYRYVVESIKTIRMKSLLKALVILLVLLASCNNRGRGLVLYVSNSGNDTWSGKTDSVNVKKNDGPLKTLEGARNELRKLRIQGKLPKGEILVEILGGTYEMSETFELENTDGGEKPESRIIFAGREGEEVRLNGGRQLKVWKPVTDEKVLNMFYPEARGKIFMTDLKAAGILTYGSPEGGGAELFFNDRPMRISRYPNTGFIGITGVLNENPVDVRGTKGDLKGKFLFSDNRVTKWVNEKDAWVHGYWFWDWSEQRHKILKIDTRRKLIEVVPPYHNYGYRTGQWFYGFNLLSEIDEPEEYYIDRTEGILYFYPPSEIKEGKAYLSVNKNIINFKNVTFVTFQGLTIEGCTGTAVTMDGCDSCIIEGCTVRNTGDNAVVINAGKSSGVSSCDIYEAGAGGILITGGDRQTLTPSGNFAENNYIHHIARLKRVYNPGISISGVGNVIKNNLIEHVPHMAIGFTGNDNIIEYNELNDVCFESNDAGAIYTGRNWTMRGNIIRYNYLRNISGFEGKGCVGIYLDDAFSSAEIYGNIFYKVTRAMMIGGGRDNKVINNIFIDCDPSIHVDSRGLGWMENLHIPDWIKEAEEKGTILGIAYKNPPYSERYPELVNIINDEPRAPKGNIVSNNICLGGNWDKPSGFWNTAIDKKARPYLKMEKNVVSPGTLVEDSLSQSIIIADPMFMGGNNPEKSEYQLDPGSPAIKAGFVPVPFRSIGLHKNKYSTGSF